MYNCQIKFQNRRFSSFDFISLAGGSVRTPSVSVRGGQQKFEAFLVVFGLGISGRSSELVILQPLQTSYPPVDCKWMEAV